MMENPNISSGDTRFDLANRLFFRLYQCANLLHKTGSRAVAQEGLTTQQWAVLGALSRPDTGSGMSIGDLARYLMVSRQNLAGVLNRLERDGRIEVRADERDRRSRLVVITQAGEKVWLQQARPKIREYYEQALGDFSVTDMAHALHYLMKLLANMERLDRDDPEGATEPE